MSPNNAELLEDMEDLPVCSPRIQQWVEDHAAYEDAEQPTFIEETLF